VATDPKKPDGEAPRPTRLPRRDFLILPLIVLATLLALVVPAEWAMRKFFPSDDVDQCGGHASGQSFHARPNCVDQMKVPEGDWATMRYNECGFRNPESCGPKPAGALRVAMLGSSTTSGYATPYDETMAARAARSFTRACGKPVEFQNLGKQGNRGERLIASARAALDLKPDAAVLVVSQTDLQLINAADAPEGSAKPARNSWNFMREIKNQMSSSRLLYMESYSLLRNDDNYVPVYLKSGHNADFMRAPLSREWRAKLAALDSAVAGVAEVMHAQNIPVLMLFTPQRAEAALASSTHLKEKVDPQLLPRELKAIATRHGFAFENGLDYIPKDMPSSEIYYAINGHPNGKGHALLATALVHGLTKNSHSALSQCTQDTNAPSR
jgi:hypothetical protein